MSVSIKLGQDVVWGTTTAGEFTGGKILSCTSKSTSKKHEQEDENGELYSLVLFDQREEITIEVLASPATTKPAIGAELDIAGQTTAIVTDSEEKWATNAAKKFSITLMKSNAAPPEEAPPEGAP